MKITAKLRKWKAQGMETGIIFSIYGGGGPSVGIIPLNVEVIFNDRIIWDDHMVEKMKLFLAEFYDVPKDTVKTQGEVNEELDAENGLWQISINP